MILVQDNESICEYLLPFQIYWKVQETFWTPCICTRYEPLTPYPLREFAPEGTHYGRLNRDMKLPFHRCGGGKFIETALKEYGVSCGCSETDFMMSVIPSALKEEAKEWWVFIKGFLRWEPRIMLFVTVSYLKTTDKPSSDN